MAEKIVVNEEIFPYPGKVKSTVWKFFGFIKRKPGPPVKDNLNMEKVICKLCLKSYANKGNTTNLQQHFDKHHRHNADLPAVSSCGPKEATSLKSQPKIDIQFTKPGGKLSQENQTMLDDLVNKLVVGKALPLSLVDSVHFKDLVNELDPRYKVPSRYEVSKYLDGKMRHMTEKLKADLPPADDSLAITHDGWTSCATQSYDTVTAHFINKDWELRTAVLQTCYVSGCHTGERIAERLQETIAKWNIPVPTAVTDNAANEKKEFQLLGWERFGCYGHRLNKAVKHALEVPEVARIRGKCRKMVTLFHQSTSLNDCLLDKQTLVYSDSPEIIGHKLINDVPTRWISSLAMLRRLSEQIAAILAIASDNKLTINKATCNNLRAYCLTFVEQNVVEGLIKLLLPFEKATTILCAENTPTMSKVLVCMAKTGQILDNERNSESPALRKVVEKLQEQLSKIIFYEEIPLMASLLNHNTKSLSFLPPQEQDNGHRLLLSKALALGDVVKVKQEVEPVDSLEPALPQLPEADSIVVNQDGSVTDDTIVIVNEPPVDQNNNEPLAKKIKCSDMDEWFDDVMVTGVTQATSLSVVGQQEVERYISSIREESDSSPSLLQWWAKNQYGYPILSVLEH